MNNFKYSGQSIPFTAAATHLAGSVHVIGDFTGVVAYDVLNGEEGQLNITGVVEITKAAPLVIAQGAEVYWDIADGEVNADNLNPIAGIAYAAAASADTKILVLLKAGPASFN